EADRRGRDGFDEPVFYRGEQCGVKHRYSDNLLLARLKALQPELYRDMPTLMALPDQPVTDQPDPLGLERLLRDALQRKLMAFDKSSPQIRATSNNAPPDSVSSDTPDSCATCATSSDAPLVEKPEIAPPNDHPAQARESL
ncbi:MAG: hypothetical protein ACKVRO_10325, partial [Micropepsaceae bacterium]